MAKMNLTSKLYQKSVLEKIKNTDWTIGTTSPFVVELDPTTVCDLACPGCISGDLLNQKNPLDRGFSTEKINSLRYDLIEEELDELKTAMKNKDLLEVADALTDILYVTYGAGHAFGINLDKCFEEVQNSNMSKLDESGKPIYNESGKVMKGPKYFKPDLSKFVS